MVLVVVVTMKFKTVRKSADKATMLVMVAIVDVVVVSLVAMIVVMVVVEMVVGWRMLVPRVLVVTVEVVDVVNLPPRRPVEAMPLDVRL